MPEILTALLKNAVVGFVFVRRAPTVWELDAKLNPPPEDTENLPVVSGEQGAQLKGMRLQGCLHLEAWE